LKDWDVKPHNEFNSLLKKISNKLKSPSKKITSPDDKYEMVKTYKSESLVENWDELQSNAEKMDLMGHGMNALFSEEKFRNNLKKSLEKGCIIRLLLLDPKSYKAIEVAELLTGQKKLQTKIEETLDHALELQDWTKKDHVKGRINIRIIREVKFKINRYDDHIFQTEYFTINEPGNNSPCKHVREGMFSFSCYLDEFNRNWDTGLEYRKGGPLPCLPAEDNFLDDYDIWKRIKQYLEYENSDQELPLPKMAVIYPTYKCTLGCNYCSTDLTKREGKNLLSMNENKFIAILDKIINAKILNIELSGGGEPLEYPDIQNIIDKISIRKEEHPELNFGILTNGLHITNEISEALAKKFSYVRLSFNEKIASNNSLRTKFMESLQKVLKKRDISTNRIGIKLLLTEELVKKEKEANFVSQMIKDISQYPINHLRIKAIRGDKTFQEQLSEVWPRILDTADDMFDNDTTINADIRQNKVGSGFKCWFGAAIMVVDPKCDVHPCLNYHNAVSSYIVGNIFKDDLKKIWISGKLKRYFKMNSPKTCNNETSVDCRMAKYQHLLEEKMATERNKDVNLMCKDCIQGL